MTIDIEALNEFILKTLGTEARWVSEESLYTFVCRGFPELEEGDLSEFVELLFLLRDDGKIEKEDDAADIGSGFWKIL